MSLFRLLAALLLFVFVSAASPQPQSGGIAIVGADVLPMTGAERLKDQTVLVTGDRIVRVGPRSRVSIPAGYKRIDARGLTLMPGLVDMHIHIPNDAGRPGEGAQRALAVMLGHGVTTARGMAGNPNNLAVRAAVERGELAGPRLYAAGPGLSSNNTKSVEAGRAAVAAANAAGYDLIKSHHLSDLAVWAAIREEARRQGLGTAGHVASQVGVVRAAEAGQQIEHLDGFLFALLPPDSPLRNGDVGQFPEPPVIRAVAAAGQAPIDALAREMKRTGSWHVPTLALFERVADPALPTQAMRAAPAMRYVPPFQLDQWAKQREGFAQLGWSAEETRMVADIRNRAVRSLHRAGVPIMAGSDTAQAFHIWGEGLLLEIEALAAAGLSPMEALRSATVVPRDYFRSLPRQGSGLGWKADFGTIEQGARADLILLKGDPSRDVKALRRLDSVIAAGKLYDRAALDKMLDQAALDAKAAVPPPPPPTAAAANFPAVVHVMRHLHTPAGERDPDLTVEGKRAAEALPAAFAANPPAVIYVSNWKRTQQSAAPLAARLGLTPKIYEAGNIDDLLARIRAESGPVLIVGHSNTVPDIVERLGGARPGALQHEDFGDVWTVSGAARTVEKRKVGGE